MNIGLNALLMGGTRAGIGNYIYNLLKALACVDADNKYQVFVNKQYPAGLWAHNQEPVPVNLTSQGSWARILWEQILLPSSIAKRDIDIMHFPDYSLPVLLGSKPSIITVHDLTYKLFPETFSRGKLLTKLALLGPSLRKAAGIIAVSNNTKKDLIEVCGVSPERITVIHNGVDPEVFKPMESGKVREQLAVKYNLEPGYILYVGTLEPRKNITTLIKAFKILKKSRRLPHKLVIAGGKGWLYREIFQAVSELGLEQEVLFTGYISADELPLFYNGAGVFVYPSLYEGFGLPPLEAMACGIPVVTSDSSSLPEVVGDAGIMVNPTEVEALSDAIDRILSDCQLADRLSVQGLQRAQGFTWEQCSRKTMAVYAQVYAGQGR